MSTVITRESEAPHVALLDAAGETWLVQVRATATRVLEGVPEEVPMQLVIFELVGAPGLPVPSTCMLEVAEGDLTELAVTFATPLATGRWYYHYQFRATVEG